MSDLANKKVLVTGAGGFIGSHLTEKLVSEGASVRAFVHYNSFGRAGWLDYSPVRNDVEVIWGDITDSESVRRAVQGTEIIFHLAALIAIPYSYSAPYSYVRTNIDGTMNISQEALRAGVSRVLHTSTSEVYGTALYVPMDEKHPLQAQSPYAASKIGADKVIESFHLSFQLPAVTIRPFNTFGPRQSARAVIPTIISQCLSNQRVSLGNLQPTRDFNYVSNTVDGYVLAASASAEAVIGKTINLGSGREISVGDLVKVISSKLGRDFEIVEDSQRKRVTGSEVERLLAENTRARTLLNWKPNVSLEDGLDNTIEWFINNKERYNANAYIV